MACNQQWWIYIVKFWTPPWSRFFQFRAVFGKIWQNRMLAPPWRVGAPSFGEILYPPLISVKIKELSWMCIFRFIHMVNKANEHLVITLCNIRDVTPQQLLSSWQAVRCLFTWIDICRLHNKTSFVFRLLYLKTKLVIWANRHTPCSIFSIFMQISSQCGWILGQRTAGKSWICYCQTIDYCFTNWCCRSQIYRVFH